MSDFSESPAGRELTMVDAMNHVGKWAVCGHNRLGRIEGRKELEWGLSYVGTGLDGQPWASRNPRVLRATDSDTLDSLAAARGTP